MAITITRTPWIDDDGTGTYGTVLNNAVKTDLYNQIDAALAKAAQLAGGNAFTGNQNVTGNVTIAGIVTVPYPGPHLIQAGSVGDVSFQMVNTQAGASSRATLLVGNNTTPYLCAIVANSSTVGTSIWGGSLPSGVEIHAFGPGGLALSCDTAAPIRFCTGAAAAVRMQIVASGEVLINAPTVSNAGLVTLGFDGAVRPNGIVIQNTATTTVNYLAFINAAGGVAGLITQITQTSVAYNTASDARLKDDEGRASDLSSLRGVVVHDFTWKADGRRARGVFAQEAHAVFPNAITEGDDDTTDDGSLAHPWMTDYSKFVPDLIAGWQQHDAEIAELRAALAAKG